MFDSWERREEAWDDYFAAGDAIRERYASELEDLRADDRQQEAEQEYMNRVWYAGFGTDWFAYEEYWKRLEKYYEEHEKELEK